MMTRPRAAHYCGLTEARFERELAAGRLPTPVLFAGQDHWDRVALDEALDRIAGDAGDFRAKSKLYAAR
jgi:anaerobic selenocysteine-containing dehydrogenase